MANTLEGVLVDATKLPASIETKLPAGAPKLSQALTSIAGAFKALPALPFNLPALPVIGVNGLPMLNPGGPTRQQLEAAALAARMGRLADLPAGTTQQTAERGTGPLPEVIVRRGM